MLYELPIVQLAMIYRMNVQSDSESETATLLESMLNEEMKKAGIFYG